MEAVAERETDLGEQRGVVLPPVGEELPDVATELPEEPTHYPPPFSTAHWSVGNRRDSGNSSFLRHGVIVSA